MAIRIHRGYPARKQRPLPNTVRYGTEVRWGSVMRTILGEGYTVIEEGLGGRTTVWNDPIEETSEWKALPLALFAVILPSIW